MTVVPSVAICMVCLLGLPGNFFVLTVYLRTMTSSTRVYMFALAVDGSAVCVCGIVLTRVLIDFITVQVITCTIDVAISFSVYLLVFVSIERLLAVRRPHTFSSTGEEGIVCHCNDGSCCVFSNGRGAIDRAIAVEKNISHDYHFSVHLDHDCLLLFDGGDDAEKRKEGC